jgi:hypothetical protein
MQRWYIVLIGAATLVACTRHRTGGEPSSSRARAVSMNSECARQVMFEEGNPIAPERPDAPPRSRRLDPEAWAEYDRELSRYRAESTRYEILMTIAQDKIQHRCSQVPPAESR